MRFSRYIRTIGYRYVDVVGLSRGGGGGSETAISDLPDPPSRPQTDDTLILDMNLPVVRKILKKGAFRGHYSDSI